ncbi:uncharacterized protein BDR25DRAFT_130555 [Lindgomyces ingoldianus]|uniref:Uncharacterized protein n=1 Tax=Lindgomyces ingoldianus TaxID=673940 RepID=A0ACB6R435_9PLEO|nr:uncharacterized protein BDR25DRAFT_130555 [Lindgomyces ingoldianus]KAF2473277.1 hypothetical protein BDR25DRAFT_130555 [Lindgomyces ingoldianus]
MEPAITGALYTAESLLEGAVAFAKGIAHPTLPLKANLTHVTSVPVSRCHHTLSVVKGRAYIFGGESEPGKLADNAMHIVILPSSGVLEADYTTIPARPTTADGHVPAPRKGHTAVVIGDSICVFGGSGIEPENGRMWVYSTVSNSWSCLDPATDSLYPSHRTGHAAASAELPGPKEKVYKERAPQQPADPAKVVPEPADEDTWGTIFIVGGRNISSNELLNDALAFDVRSRTWSNIPTPLGQPREGASMELMGNRLYLFGGKGVETFASGGMELVDVSPVWKHAESGTTPLTSGWGWEEISHADGEAPQARSGAGLVGVTTGQGRHYLLAVGGEGEGQPTGEFKAKAFISDIWAFQIPSERATAASVKDATKAGMRKDTNEARWAEVQYKFLDSMGEEEKEVPGEPKQGLGVRGAFAVARGTEVDGASVVVWGGMDGRGTMLGDGWLVTVDR